jgi:sugar (glycoside-pentoside-hexuronide) transporter
MEVLMHERRSLMAENTGTAPNVRAAYDRAYIGKKELWIYAAAAGGQGMIYAIMSSYISDFYLNVLGLTPVFVLLLMLLARVWDAVNDPIMGIIVDKTETRWGKFKPYILMTPVPVAVLTFLLFFAPDISLTGKMIYAGTTYVLWGMIYTMSDVPFWSLPNAMTPNPKERATILSLGRTVNGIGGAIPMMIVMGLGWLLPLFGLSGNALERTRYMSAAIVASVVGNLVFITVYFFAKERVRPARPVRKPGNPNVLKLVFTSKPLMLIVLMGILSSTRYLMQAGAIHVARYSFYIGPALEGMDAAAREVAIQSSISTVNLMFTLCTALGSFGAMLLMPGLYKKYSYKQIIIGTNALGIAACIAMYFIGYENFWFFVPFLIIASIPLGAINITSYAMIGDALDYMEWKTGRRENGLGNACQSFVNKLGNALSTTFIVLMYILVNLDVNTISKSTVTIDPASLDRSVRQGMFMMVSLIPAIGMILSSIPVLFYDISGKKKEKMLQELSKMREERGTVIEG